MKSILFSLLIGLTLSTTAQDTLKRYFDENLLPTDKKHAVFNALVTKKDDHYVAQVLSEKGNVLMKGEYRDKNLFTRDGEFALYRENGSSIFETTYEDNRINGHFSRWNPNGTISDSGMVKYNRCLGQWMGYHSNGHPSYKVNYGTTGYSQPDLPANFAIAHFAALVNANNMQLYTVPDGAYVEWYDNGQVKDSSEFSKGKRNGKWRSWYSDGKLESEGKFLNDSAVGNWKWYHSTGNISTNEMYKGGKLTDLSCYDSSGKPSGFTCPLETRPHPTGDSVEGSFEDYIIANLYYPKDALRDRIEGMVNFEFLIGKEGKLKSVNIISSPSDILSEEVVRLLKSVRAWAPAISHNRKIDYLYEFSVPFRLPD